jgi:hypothetical protein
MIHRPPSEQLPLVLARPILTAIESGQYSDYLLRIYQHKVDQPLTTAPVYVVEVDGFDIPSGRLSSIPIQWWRVEHANAYPVDPLDMSPFNTASDKREPLFPHPIIKVLVDWPRALCMESVGPMIRRSVILTLQQVNNTLEIVDEELVWLANLPDQVMVGEIT